MATDMDLLFCFLQLQFLKQNISLSFDALIPIESGLKKKKNTLW